MFGYRDAGILGFNSALIGLALGKFYQLNTALWIMAPVVGMRRNEQDFLVASPAAR